MNLFKRDIDKKATLEMIRKVLQGIGKPNFDEGTGVQAKAEMTNIVLEDEDFIKAYGDLKLPSMKDIDMSCFNKTKLSFTLPSGNYIAKIEMDSFEITRQTFEKKADIYNHFEEKDLTVNINGNEEEDEAAVKALIERFSQEDIALFNATDESSYNDTVMGLGYDGAYCLDRQIGWLLFGFIAKSMGFLRPAENNKLLDIFMLGNEGIRFPDLEAAMRVEMMQTFNILKDHDHDIDNQVESNDMDNYLYYVEKGDIQGNVYISQNCMFLVARNVKTNVLKVWNTMQVVDDLMYCIEDSLEYDDNDNTVFNVANYLQDFTNARYANKYDYPFEFNTPGYRKSVDVLLNEFETATDGLVYDSEKGYMPAQYMSFNTLANELSYSTDLMTDEYGLERDKVVLTKLDINSPEYFIRKHTSGLERTRSGALFYLFSMDGHWIDWNGKTFTAQDNILKDYAPTAGETDYSPLKADRAFAFGKTLIFNLPKDLPPAWRKVAFEMIAYLNDWLDKNPDNEEGAVYKDDVAKLFEEYYDDEVMAKVIEGASK